ncbi:hypothetical protein D3C76_1785320 [compost metagenome]
MTEENVKKVLKYREQGNSMREIARLTGLSSASVHRIISAHLLEVAPYDPEVHG